MDSVKGKKKSPTFETLKHLYFFFFLLKKKCKWLNRYPDMCRLINLEHFPGNKVIFLLLLKYSAFSVSLHITSVSEAISVTTGVTRTFSHKVDSMNQTAAVRRPRHGLTSASSRSARFKLLRINSRCSRAPVGWQRSSREGSWRRAPPCVTRVSENGVARGKTLKGFSAMSHNSAETHEGYFKRPETWRDFFIDQELNNAMQPCLDMQKSIWVHCFVKFLLTQRYNFSCCGFHWTCRSVYLVLDHSFTW